MKGFHIVIGTAVTQVCDCLHQQDWHLIHRTDKRHRGTFHLFQSAAILVYRALLLLRHVKRRTCGYLSKAQSQFTGKALRTLPDRIVAKALRSPRIITRHPAVMKHGAAAEIDLAHLHAIALPRPAGTAVYNNVRMQALYCQRGGHGCRLTTYEVTVMLAPWQHYIYMSVTLCLPQFTRQRSKEILPAHHAIMLYQRLSLSMHGNDITHLIHIIAHQVSL